MSTASWVRVIAVAVVLAVARRIRRRRPAATRDPVEVERGEEHLYSMVAAAVKGELAECIASGSVAVTERAASPEAPIDSVVVEPVNDGAAPIFIGVEDNALNLSPGSSGMWCEFWSQSDDELVTEARDLARACRDGRYEETVRPFSNSVQCQARWPTSDGPAKPQLNILFARPKPGKNGWRLVTYEPY